MIPIAAEHTPEWHAARATGIGASEAAAACGISRWETPLDLWARKVGRKPPAEPTDAMRLGTLMEPAIREFFAYKTGIGVDVPAPGLYRHPDIACVLASPDALLADGTLGEFKRTGSHVYSDDELGESGTDQVPVEWFAQAQQQMAVTGAPAVRFGVLVDARELRTYLVDRDTRIIDKILEGDCKLWGCVQSDTPPEINWEHKRACDAVRSAFLAVRYEGEFISLDEEAGKIWAKYQAYTAAEKEAAEFKKRAQAELMARIQDAHGGILPCGSLLKKVVVKSALIPEHTRESYSYLRLTKGKTS